MRTTSSYPVIVPALARNLLAALLLLAACTKVPEAGRRVPVASGDPIGFAVAGQETKGKTPLTTLAALAGQDFGVSAWYTPEGETFDVLGSTSVKYFENQRFGYIKESGEDNSYANHAWQGVTRASDNAVSPNPVYWPLDGTLTFFCYAPYRSDAGAATPPDPDGRDIVLEAPVTDPGIISRLPDYLPGSPLIRVTPAASASEQADFLCAPALLDKSRSDALGTFPLDFGKHWMTRVEFWFNETGFVYPTETVPEGEVVAVRVMSVSLKNIIGSRYLYFTEAAPYRTECAWSGEVSPAAPADASAAFPRATYRISGDARELKTIAYFNAQQVNVPVRNDANDNHISLHTNRGLLFLLPQELPDDAELEVVYALVEQHGLPVISEILTCSLPATSLVTWPEGKVVRYLLTLDLSERAIVGVKTLIIPWEDAGNPYYEQEMLY